MEDMLRMAVVGGQADAGAEQQVFLNRQIGVHDVILQPLQPAEGTQRISQGSAHDTRCKANANLQCVTPHKSGL